MINFFFFFFFLWGLSSHSSTRKTSTMFKKKKKMKSSSASELLFFSSSSSSSFFFFFQFLVRNYRMIFDTISIWLVGNFWCFHLFVLFQLKDFSVNMLVTCLMMSEESGCSRTKLLTCTKSQINFLQHRICVHWNCATNVKPTRSRKCAELRHNPSQFTLGLLRK